MKSYLENYLIFTHLHLKNNQIAYL
jgi:hypothetical protein